MTQNSDQVSTLNDDLSFEVFCSASFFLQNNLVDSIYD